MAIPLAPAVVALISVVGVRIFKVVEGDHVLPSFLIPPLQSSADARSSQSGAAHTHRRNGLVDLPATGLGRRDGPRLVRGPEVQPEERDRVAVS